MGKDPAFLFYPNDYIGGTMGMTFEEKGAYIELLMMQFNRGHMTEHMIGQIVGQLWDKLKHKFKKDENELWYNERLEYEQKKRKSYTESRKNNKTGKNQYTKKSGHTTKDMTNDMSGHNDGRMEDENEDRNRDTNKKEKEDFKREICHFYDDKDFQEAFNDYLKTRQRLKATNSERAIKTLLNKIMELSGGLKQEAIKLIDTSNVNAWKSIYPEKDNKQTGQQQQYKTQLEIITERNKKLLEKYSNETH